MAAKGVHENGAVLQQKEFHIFGNGISFSISPIIHNAGFRHHELPYTYDIRESGSVDDVVSLIQADTFGGASVTMPHKLQVHKLCDRVTETSQLIGAINTLYVGVNGEKRIIVGDNTDWSGLHSIIQDYKGKTQRTPGSGLVIGAGGASRAALYAMSRAGVHKIYLLNRTVTTAEFVRESFKDAFPIIVVAAIEELPEQPEIVIGTIPADRTTEDQFTNLFGSEGLCIDMSYKPRQTPLLTVAQRHPGWETVMGVDVLLAQAFDQYRIWTNREPPKTTMVEAVIAHEAGLGNSYSDGKL